MSFEALKWAAAQRGLPPLHKLALFSLADCHNGITGQCNPSLETIADACGMSKSAAKNAIRELRKVGLIESVARRTGKLNLANCYSLHLAKVGHNTPQGGAQYTPPIGHNTPQGGAQGDPGVGRRVTPNQEEESGSESGNNKAPEKPSRARRESAAIDSRHAEFKVALAEHWKSANSDEMPWDGSEAKTLRLLLIANPALAVERFRELLGNRQQSDVNHAERPRKWVGSLTDYATALDRYGKPLASPQRSGPWQPTAAPMTEVGEVANRLENAYGNACKWNAAAMVERGKAEGFFAAETVTPEEVQVELERRDALRARLSAKKATVFTGFNRAEAAVNSAISGARAAFARLEESDHSGPDGAGGDDGRAHGSLRQIRVSLKPEVRS